MVTQKNLTQRIMKPILLIVAAFILAHAVVVTPLIGREPVQPGKRITFDMAVSGNRETLSNVIQEAGNAFGVRFCVESCSADAGFLYETKVVMGRLENVSLEQFVARLTAKGLHCSKKGNTILITSPGVTKLKENPLDVVVPGVKFEGSHEEFQSLLNAMDDGIPSSPSGGTKGHDPTKKNRYKLNFTKPVTIREMLLAACEQTGTTFDATIKWETPKPAGVLPAGANKPFRGDRVELYFGSIR